MNKVELINVVAEKSGLSKKDSEKAVNAFTAAVKDALSDGERVQIVGFGSFEVRERAEKNGVNPKTKQPMTIPASKSPAFKAGKALKDALK